MTPSAAIAVLESLRPRAGLDVPASEQYAAVNLAIAVLDEADNELLSHARKALGSFSRGYALGRTIMDEEQS